jgi:hypothetical protein
LFSVRILLMGSVGLLAGSLTCAASVVNIDFQGFSSATPGVYYPVYTGQGAYVTADAHIWNGYELYYGGGGSPRGTPPPSTGLLASDGTVTTVGFALADQLTAEYVGNSPLYLNLLNDYAYVVSDPGDDTMYFTISGLIAGRSYGLYLYGTAGDAGQGSIFRIDNGSPANRQTSGGNDGSFVEGDVATNPLVDSSNYVVFSGVVADGSGQITGSLTSNGVTPWGAFNGLQIVETPEPSSLVLLAGAAGLMAGVRRRRK